MRSSFSGYFTSFDGTELFYRAWEPCQPTHESVLVLHRGHEHSGRVGNIVEELEMPERWAFSFDLRGHGMSPGERGWADDFTVWINDLNAFALFIEKTYSTPLTDMAVVANSVGAVMTAAWVHDYAPGIRGMVLGTPAFEIKLYVPLALSSLKLAQNFKKELFVTSYVRSNLLTRDNSEAKAYDSDPLITKRIAVPVLTSLFDVSKRILSDAKAIETPTLVLSSENDFVVKNNAQKVFFDRLGSKDKTFRSFSKFRHAIFHEKDRHIVFSEVRAFLQRAFAKKVYLPAFAGTPRDFTTAEFQKLLETPTTGKRLYYYALRTALATLGKTSGGISLGLSQGFDSGASLDYVYRNRASGKNLLGKAIDRMYLNAVGWRGVRVRKDLVKSAILKVAKKLHEEGKPLSILDVAAGHASYALECAKELPFEVSFECRDTNANNLEAVKRLAEAKGISRLSVKLQDAFAPVVTEKKYTIAIVSGLYELVEDNRMVASSLQNIFSELEMGGYLIYTGQPWHPQLELIGRVLNNHKGKRWLMRRRIQTEMDELVQRAGFRKIETYVEGQGIFTTSIAQKP